ncbi:MAG: hypothetical protein ACK6D3_00210 [Planctomycetaceae bacterium]|jgi:hypothetical protein
MLSPRQIFEDNIRPADLLLKVYRLLEHDAPNTEEGMLRTLRDLVQADTDEGLMVIYNEVFLGLIRERAEVPPASIKRSALCNLLRQSVVTASTALETYLPILLRHNLPEVIRLRGKDFVPKQDGEITTQFKNLTFDLGDAVRILTDPDPLFIANKMISSLNFSYLSGKRGIHVCGVLLSLEKPWELIAKKLGEEQKKTHKEGEEKEISIQKRVEATVKRRNDIVHRADRSQDDPAGAIQEISFPWTKLSVESIRAVCLALDDLVVARINELKTAASLTQPQEVG